MYVVSIGQNIYGPYKCIIPYIEKDAINLPPLGVNIECQASYRSA